MRGRKNKLVRGSIAKEAISKEIHTTQTVICLEVRRSQQLILPNGQMAKNFECQVDLSNKTTINIMANTSVS